MAQPRECSLLVMQDEPHYFDGESYSSEMNFGYFVDWVASHLFRTTSAPTMTSCHRPRWSPIPSPRHRFRDQAGQPLALSLRIHPSLGDRSLSGNTLAVVTPGDP